MKNNEAKILVEIAAYKDSELLNTINSALIQADNPDRIYFSICYQSDDLDTLEKLKKIKNCKIKYLKASEAKGSCYARYLCQKMIDDEDYIFQIDAHMRFVKHWDNKMIEELLSLNDPKACISFYPPSCTEEMMTLPFDDKIFDNPGPGGVMYTTDFRPNSLMNSNCSYTTTESNNEAPAKNPFISAGNFFSFSQIHKDILHDPEMYFYGDEMPMAVRYYTHGWNNYTNNKSYVYHQYCRPNQEFPIVRNSDKNEILRFRRLINIDNENYDMKEFGLGKERTIKQFEEFSGLDYSNRIIYLDAELGRFNKPKMDKKISFIRKQKIEEDKYINKSENIEVIIIDIKNNIKECIKSLNSTKSNINNISYIIGTTSNKKIDKKYITDNNIKDIEYFEKDTHYSKILTTLIPKLGDSYTMIIDSSVRSLNDWDRYSCETIKICGTKSALTNWVWRINEDTNIEEFTPYNNVIKELDVFYYYVPVYKYNTEIKLEERKNPYKTPFISDGFLFIKSKDIKKLKIDPELNYEEQKYILSVNLFTNGISIYYPLSSYFIRTDDESNLNTEDRHLDVLSGLLGINNFYSKSLSNEYKYTLGSERTLWEWYEYIGIDPTDEKNK